MISATLCSFPVTASRTEASYDVCAKPCLINTTLIETGFPPEKLGPLSVCGVCFSVKKPSNFPSKTSQTEKVIIHILKSCSSQPFAYSRIISSSFAIAFCFKTCKQVYFLQQWRPFCSEFAKETEVTAMLISRRETDKPERGKPELGKKKSALWGEGLLDGCRSLGKVESILIGIIIPYDRRFSAFQSHQKYAQCFKVCPRIMWIDIS